MTLFEEAFEECTMLDKTSVSDGMGGMSKVWFDGTKFRASIYKNNTLEAKIAEKQGVTEVYTVFVEEGTRLDYHDVFRRSSNGLTYRVTSNLEDSETPARASFYAGQVTAERWDLPNG